VGLSDLMASLSHVFISPAQIRASVCPSSTCPDAHSQRGHVNLVQGYFANIPDWAMG
jgi:hypothetical protein